MCGYMSYVLYVVLCVVIMSTFPYCAIINFCSSHYKWKFIRNYCVIYKNIYIYIYIYNIYMYIYIIYIYLSVYLSINIYIYIYIYPIYIYIYWDKINMWSHWLIKYNPKLLILLKTIKRKLWVFLQQI